MNVYLWCVEMCRHNLEIHHMISILIFRQIPHFRLAWREFVGYHSQPRHGFKSTTVKMLHPRTTIRKDVHGRNSVLASKGHYIFHIKAKLLTPNEYIITLKL